MGKNPYVKGGGNRVATLLIYINQPDGGGHTAFPNKDKKWEEINQNYDSKVCVNSCSIMFLYKIQFFFFCIL